MILLRSLVMRACCDRDQRPWLGKYLLSGASHLGVFTGGFVDSIGHGRGCWGYRRSGGCVHCEFVSIDGCLARTGSLVVFI